eukprot:c24252_g1_i1 orf=646-1761(-)
MGRQPSRGPGEQLHLPAGFRFYPTDEELVVHYLCKKAASQPFAVPIIAEVDLYKFNPWDLPDHALFGEKEWYFFSPRDRKYPNGSRPNRAAASGYWKATGTDKPISTAGGTQKVGIKKALVFYEGRAPTGSKTNWIMHEYRLADSGSKSAKKKGSLRLDDWVLCRIYKKTSGAQKAAKEHSESSHADDVLASLPDIYDNKVMNFPRLSSLGGSGVQQDIKPNPNLLANQITGQSSNRAEEQQSSDYTMLESLGSIGNDLSIDLATNPTTSGQSYWQLDQDYSQSYQRSASSGLGGGPSSWYECSRSDSNEDDSVESRNIGLPSLLQECGGFQVSSDSYLSSDSYFSFDSLPSPFGKLEPLTSYSQYFSNME